MGGSEKSFHRMNHYLSQKRISVIKINANVSPSSLPPSPHSPSLAPSVSFSLSGCVLWSTLIDGLLAHTLPSLSTQSQRE